jgi:hypothetical protein
MCQLIDWLPVSFKRGERLGSKYHGLSGFARVLPRRKPTSFWRDRNDNNWSVLDSF